MLARAFKIILLVVLAAPVSAHDYVFRATAVPLAPGSNDALPRDVNNAGQVVGEMVVQGVSHGYSWRQGEEMRLLRGPFNEPAAARRVNNSGLIVGVYFFGSRERPCYWTGSDLAQDMGLPVGAESAFPVGVSEDGTVYGNYETGGDSRFPFRWTQATGIQAVPLNPFMEVDLLTGVGPNGQALGFGRRTATSQRIQTPFLLNGTGFSFLKNFSPSTLTVPRAINGMGMSVGSADIEGEKPCMWHGQNFVHLMGLPPGYSSGRAIDINEEDTIVGGTDQPETGWVGDHHALVDINVVPVPGETLPKILGALAINDDGIVLARGVGSPAGWLLTPQVVEWTGVWIAELLRGRVVGGDEGSLTAVDNQAAVLEGGLNASSGSKIEFLLEGTTTFASPNRLVFRSVSRQSSNQARMKVDLWDWQAGQYDPAATIDDFVPENVFGLHDIAPSGNLSRFVQPGTKRMRARVRIFSEGPSVGRVEFDQLSWFAG